MARAKRSTLPKDFEATVRTGDLSRLIEVFDACDVNARGGSAKAPALAVSGIPVELIRWLVEHGADIDAPDDRGESPLHHHAGSWNGRPGELIALGATVDARDRHGRTPLFAASIHPAHTATLIAAGADVNAADDTGATALGFRLGRTSNADLVRVAETVRMLLDAGAAPDPDAPDAVRRIGERFEEMRSAFDPGSVDAASAALERLYSMFGVDPAPRRVPHDGVSPIAVLDGDPALRFAALWDALVPPVGAAPTLQGETIRVAGRVSSEIDGNGGVNWDAGFRAMLDALPEYLAGGVPLDPALVAEARDLASATRPRGAASSAELARLRELAVLWVASNPTPIPFADPAYPR